MKKMKLSRFTANMLTIAAFAVTAASCREDVPESVTATGVTLNQTTPTLVAGETATLTATVSPKDAADKTLTWSSSAPAVATVSGGTVTALAEGTAIITVTAAGKKTATCTVTVRKPEPVAVTGVTLDPTALTLVAGETATLTATVMPEDAADKTLAWSSSAPAVATVDGGTVTALAGGTAIITVTAAGKKTATCTVTVQMPEPDVYIAGYETVGNKAVATIWKNGVATALTNGENHAFAYSIFVK